jgi:hypothetical protein
MRGEARGAETGAVTGARMDEGLYGDGSEEDEEVVVGEGAEAEMVMDSYVTHTCTDHSSDQSLN